MKLDGSSKYFHTLNNLLSLLICITVVSWQNSHGRLLHRHWLLILKILLYYISIINRLLLPQLRHHDVIITTITIVILGNRNIVLAYSTFALNYFTCLVVFFPKNERFGHRFLVWETEKGKGKGISIFGRIFQVKHNVLHASQS